MKEFSKAQIALGERMYNRFDRIVDSGKELTMGIAANARFTHEGMSDQEVLDVLNHVVGAYGLKGEK